MTKSGKTTGTFRNGLPAGYSMQDMADDYAVMIKEEFGGPVDVIGTSTGGSIAQHFAADHPSWFACWCSKPSPTPWAMPARMSRCAQILAEDWSALFQLLEEGKIEPIIAERSPLLEAAKANALLECGRIIGSI